MKKNKKVGKIAASVGFALICFLAGFYFATGLNQPTQSIAQQTSLPANPPLMDAEGNSPFIRVAEVVQPIVVNITAEKRMDGDGQSPLDMFDLGPFFRGQPRPDQVPKQRKMPLVTSGGSGIILDQEGYILTNNHVIEGAEDITVKFADKSEKKAKVIGTDPDTDVALIKVDGKLPIEMVAKLGDSDKIRIGEWAIAVGNPFGLDWTVTVGVISARGRSNLAIGGQGPAYQDFIQTDASINFGNSGGPLINIRGEVIGINTAINSQGQGIGFAIPINLAKHVVDQLRNGGAVKRGYLGIMPSELDETRKEALGLDPALKGIFVEGVEENTPGDKGGLIAGDVITEINGSGVTSVTEFRFKVADFAPGANMTITVIRDGKEKKMQFVLGDRSEYFAMGKESRLKQSDTWLGIGVVPTTGKQGRKLGVEKVKGVLVINVLEDSPAFNLLEAGDVITEIGNREINSLDDFNDAAKEMKDRTKAIAFWVIRDGRKIFIPVKPLQ